jgi:hypothetical protein
MSHAPLVVRMARACGTVRSVRISARANFILRPPSACFSLAYFRLSWRALGHGLNTCSRQASKIPHTVQKGTSPCAMSRRADPGPTHSPKGRTSNPRTLRDRRQRLDPVSRHMRRWDRTRAHVTVAQDFAGDGQCHGAVAQRCQGQRQRRTRYGIGPASCRGEATPPCRGVRPGLTVRRRRFASLVQGFRAGVGGVCPPDAGLGGCQLRARATGLIDALPGSASLRIKVCARSRIGPGVHWIRSPRRGLRRGAAVSPRGGACARSCRGMAPFDALD